MAEITASMVKELREKTDAPMMECKKALTEANGDMGKAEEILRVKLGNKAGKAASRITAEGVVKTASVKVEVIDTIGAGDTVGAVIAAAVVDAIADKGIFHKNKAARDKSRLSTKVKALATA